MKPTPSERIALAKAKSLSPLTREQAFQIADNPDLSSFDGRHDRRRLAETRLVWAAEDWIRRKSRLDFVALCRREGDRNQLNYHRVTALDHPTKRIRHNLTAALESLAEAQAAEFMLL